MNEENKKSGNAIMKTEYINRSLRKCKDAYDYIL